ncbi:MAG: transporter substrate-binding domain-containing protein [Candidatus Hodarchaeales archaeon]|jgi:polar amino acid transport system substrate-binding protein
MNHKRSLILLVIGVSLFGMVFLSNAPIAVRGDALDDIKERGKLIVGADTEYPPFEEYNATTDETLGFDVDIGHQIARKIGVDIEFKSSAWEPIIPNLNAKQFDIILSAMTITPLREESVDFSRWYYKSFQGILVTTANPDGFTVIGDLNATGVKVGLQAGTTSDIYFNESLTAATRNTFNSLPLAIESLKSGVVDAVIGDYAVLAKDEAESGATKLLDNLFSPEDFGIAVRTGETALLDVINEVIEELLGTDPANPVPSDLYNIMYFKWFDVNAPDYDGTVTTGDIPLAGAAGGGVGGFEVLAVLSLFFIPVIRKVRK